MTKKTGKGKSLEGISRGEVSSHPGHVFVRSGDVALTRALLSRGALRVLSRRGGRVIQIGVAALAEAIEAARVEVEATAGERAVARERGRAARAVAEERYRDEFACAVRRLYPSIPDEDVEGVVSRALEVSSGRVGRTAAAKALADEPVRLAVLAHIRHQHTDYDARLRRAGLGQRFGRASREDRQKARKAVKSTIESVAACWAAPRAPGVEAPAPVSAPTLWPEADPAPDRPPGASVTAPLATPAPRVRARPRPPAMTKEPAFEQRPLWQRPLG